MAIDWNVEIVPKLTDKTFQTVPTGSNLPYYFENEISIDVKVIMTVITGPDVYENVLEVHGKAYSYLNNNNNLPHLDIVQLLEGSTAVVSFYVRGWDLSVDYLGTEIHYKNGIQEDYSSFTTKSRSMVSAGVTALSSSKELYVNSSIPVVFGTQAMRDELYPGSDFYYYTSQWEYFDVFQVIDLKKCVNLKETAQELTEYVYYGLAEQYKVDEFGNATRTDAPAIYRGIKVKSKERCSLYEIENISDGVLKMGMNLQGVEIAYYSTDGVTWQNVPGQPSTLPWDYLYRNWRGEVGTFYALSIVDTEYPTNMYVYKTKAESDAYNDGQDNERDAINFSAVSTGYTPTNNTGEEDDATIFGQVGVRSIFSQQYILSTSALSEIANAFFDVTQGGISGIFEDIKKGCEMYGESVVDDLESLYYYPVDLTQVFANSISPQSYIYFGGYKFDMQNSVNRIIFPNGYYDFGSFTIETTFGDNIRSYEPYTKLYCYLAYIGWVQLDMKKYLHKTVNIRYYIDTRTGGCVACLVADGILCDYYNGQIGVSMPMKATDFNSYANAQIQTLLGFNKSANTGVAGDFAKNVGSGLVESGAVSGATVGVAGLGIGASIQATKTLYGLTQNNMGNFTHTIGGSSSMLNMFLPQECLFMFEIQNAMPTEYERELIGLPSNASGSINSFNGYLECEQVNLICADATASEKAEIVNMLHSGVYI